MLTADGKAGLRMKEGECGIGVSSVDRPFWVAGEARAKFPHFGHHLRAGGDLGKRSGKER